MNKVNKLNESDVQRIVKKVINEEVNMEMDVEKLESLLNKIFPPINIGRYSSRFISTFNIPSDYRLYAKSIGKSEEEIIEEYINLTPLQLYEKTKLYMKEHEEKFY